VVVVGNWVGSGDASLEFGVDSGHGAPFPCQTITSDSRRKRNIIDAREENGSIKWSFLCVTEHRICVGNEDSHPAASFTQE
jgi:hypothetical protein